VRALARGHRGGAHAPGRRAALPAHAWAVLTGWLLEPLLPPPSP
jgi:hypothetical protein